MTLVRIMADDLTGALDTASQFARDQEPLPVFWETPLQGDSGGSYAFDTETREIDEPTAISRVADRAAMFRDAELSFKKIDSLLRGNTAAEIATCYARGGFRSAVVAPAFPAQNRITRAGRQYVRATAADDWHAIEPDLITALGERGIPPQFGSSPRELRGDGLFLCDAERDEGLLALSAREDGHEPPVLWCGSAGLAMALRGAEGVPARANLPAPMLFLIGSDAPNSRRQVETLEQASPGCLRVVREVTPESGKRALEGIAERLCLGQSAGLAFAFLEQADRKLAGRDISRVLSHLLPDLPMPGSVFVCGGETLYRLCRELGARALSVRGDLFPGVPVSAFESGPWRGLPLVTKSGGFGGPGLLVEILDAVGGERHGEA